MPAGKRKQAFSAKTAWLVDESQCAQYNRGQIIDPLPPLIEA
jgi:hypothetical protein